MTSDELIDKWLYSAEVVMAFHYEAARMFERRHFWIGVPAIALSTLVGTTVFAALRKDVHLSVQLGAGCASVLAAILTALQTFLGYSERATKHEAAGANYAALIREIHQQRAFPSPTVDELRKFVDHIRIRFDTLSKESPSLPERVWKRGVSQK